MGSKVENHALCPAALFGYEVDEFQRLPKEEQKRLLLIFKEFTKNNKGIADWLTWLKDLGRLEGDGSSARLAFRGKHLYLHVGNRRLLLASVEELASAESGWKKLLFDELQKTESIEKRLGFIQNSEEPGIPSLSALLRSYELNRPSALSWSGRVSKFLALGCDTTSGARNTLSATAFYVSAKISAKLSQIVGFLGIANGILLIAGGINLFYRQCQAAKESYKLKDRVGVGFNAATAGMGLSLAAIGVGFLFAFAETFSTKIAPHIVSLGIKIIQPAATVLYSIVAITASLQLFICGRFRKTLQEKKAEGLETSLEWLKSQVTLSKEEEKAVRDKALKENKSVAVELEKALQKKWKQFERCVGKAACDRVRDLLLTREFDNLLERVKSGEKEAIEKANALLQEVLDGNYKRIAVQLLLLVIAVLGFAATWTLGPASPILFAIGAVLWIFIDSERAQNLFAEAALRLPRKIASLWKRKERPPVEPPAPGQLSRSSSKSSFSLAEENERSPLLGFKSRRSSEEDM